MGELRKLRLGNAENVVTPYTAEDDSIIINQTTRQIKVNPEVIATQDDLDDVKEDLNDKADVIISTASGSIAHFEDGAEAYAKSVIAHIEPVQEGSGDPSPTNVRPITGHTEANVMRTGKNLLDDALRYQNANQQTLVFGQTKSYTVEQKTFLKAGTYTYSVKCDSTQRTSGYYRKTGDTENTRLWTIVYGDVSGTFTLDVDSWCAFWVYDANTIDSENIYAQIELGSTATDYEPYQGETYPITFPTEAGTVYGGYVDVTNGELVVDMARVDMGTLNFIAASPALATGFAGRVQISDRLFGYDVTEAYCDSYAFFGNGTTLRISSDIQNGQFAYQATNTYVWFRNDSCSTLEELKTALSGVYLVYKLAEPIHYQLTPQQITTLLGTNNVWADTGDVEVEYRADTKLYIEQLTKPTEDDMTANANIASGKFFMIGNRLFLSTAAIASGDTINPGTNCTELSLADALNNLN